MVELPVLVALTANLLGPSLKLACTASNKPGKPGFTSKTFLCCGSLPAGKRVT